MFLGFYQMREQPFGTTPDPRFLYLGQSHREALASLFYGIAADRGFVALIAHPGLGKTTLTFQLLEHVERTARTVFLFHTPSNSRELFQYLLTDLGVDATGMEIASMHTKLNEILLREKLAGRRFILAIDEAQNLDPGVLETIRLLSNFETPRAKLLQILLIGQPQLASKLASPTLVQLRQRISVFARLEPLGSEETARYIAHRLQVAGYGGGPLFTPEALQIIADRSQGIPRTINNLCFSALSLSCAKGQRRIDAEIMREVIADLDMESLHNAARMMPCAPIAAVTASPVLTYRPPSQNRVRRWAVSTGSAAASIVLAAMFLSYSPGRAGRFWRAIPEGYGPALHTGAFPKHSMDVSSASTSISSLSNKMGEIPMAASMQSSPPSNEAGTFKVVVQTGETLLQIARHTLGDDSGKVIEQIRTLNPGMTDVNHIEPGQEIRLPPLFTPSDPPTTTDEASDMFGKN